jgi:hypothetical protein
MADPAGHYSAAEHKIGKIPASGTSAEQDVFDLANAIEDCPTTSRLGDKQRLERGDVAEVRVKPRVVRARFEDDLDGRPSAFLP